jgi:signal transduction histidine kinase
MFPSGTRPERMFSLVILLALLATAAWQVSGGVNTDIDPDAVIIISTLLLVAAIAFCAVWKYANFSLQVGLALIIYALGVDLVEDFTREFNLGEIVLLAVILAAGFFILIRGIVAGRKAIDRSMADLRRQEAELRARSEELAATSAALEKANGKLRLLARITRHDIGNRLLSASGFLMISRKPGSAEEKDRHLEKVARSLGSIREIIAFTKTYEEIGLVPSRWQRVHPLIDAAARQLKRDDVTIDNRMDPGIEVFSDAMIGRVFFNLIDNALSHGGTSLTWIRFSAEADGTGLLITCENDGDEIAETDKERIFEQGVGQHTGLGLFLAREILSITAITITETGRPGQGVRFEIHVPAGTYRYAGETPAPQ